MSDEQQITTVAPETATETTEAAPTKEAIQEPRDSELFNKILDRFDLLDKKNEELLKRNNEYEKQITDLTEKLNKTEKLVKDNITEVISEFDFKKEFDRITQGKDDDEEKRAREDFQQLKSIFRKA